jgi:phosphoribosylglycinamide formyltransferase-1
MTQKLPITVLIGRGTRLPTLLDHLAKPNTTAQVTIVVSHKKLDEGDEDVPGIKAAKEHGIPSFYWNLVQWRDKTGRGREDFDEALGFFVSQTYYGPPQAVFMLGWDLILSEKFLKFFSRSDGLYNIINLHPALLPDNPHETEIKLSTGQKIPVIKGEHDEVIQKAIDLKLPALGATMHFAATDPDSGLVIKRVEVPLMPNDTLDSFEKRLLPAENQLVIDVANLFSQGKIKIENGRVEILS